MWYLTFQYVCYLAFYVSGLLKTRKQKIAVLILFSLIEMFISCTFDINGLFLSMWGLNAFSFTAGCVAALYPTIKNIGVVSGLLFLALFYTYYFALGNPEVLWLRNPSKSIIALMFVLCVVSLFPQNLPNKIQLVTSAIGSSSYYIYLVHAFFIFSLPQLAKADNNIIAITQLILVIVLFVPALKYIDKSISKLISK